jgi:hypothetical protein
MLQITRGDSFPYAFAVVVDELPADMTDWDVVAAVFVQGAERFPIAIEWIDRAAGKFSIDPDTSAWPLRLVQLGIRYTTDSGDKFTTELMTINVQRGMPI